MYIIVPACNISEKLGVLYSYVRTLKIIILDVLHLAEEFMHIKSLPIIFWPQAICSRNYEFMAIFMFKSSTNYLSFGLIRTHLATLKIYIT